MLRNGEKKRLDLSRTNEISITEEERPVRGEIKRERKEGGKERIT